MAQLGPKTIKTLDELILDFLAPYKNTNCRVFCDSFYAHPSLAEILYNDGIGMTGTLRPNRKDVPPELRKVKLKKNEAVYYQKEPVSIMTLKDKKTFSLMTTWDDYSDMKGKDNKNSMSCILNYNKSMGGVDLLNQYCASYRYPHRTSKWWKSLFFQILEISLANSYILYKKVLKNKISFRDFRVKVALKLVGDLSKTFGYLNNGSLSYEGHFPAKLMNIHAKPCRVCYKKGLNGKSTYKCKKCSEMQQKEIVLCVLCFETFHENIHEYMERKKNEKRVIKVEVKEENIENNDDGNNNDKQIKENMEIVKIEEKNFEEEIDKHSKVYKIYSKDSKIEFKMGIVMDLNIEFPPFDQSEME